MKITIASTNKGKIQEIINIIRESKFWELEIQALQDASEEPDEPYAEFLSNAIHKAQYYGNRSQQITLADDSGLCIEALNDFPGVKTKDFIKECGNLEKTFARLKEMLAEANNSRAYFHTALVLFFPSTGQMITHEDRHYGSLIFPPRGNEGFGFDPVFIPEGYQKTVAELGPAIKNKISHRAKALRGLLKKLNI